jgi:hypothetical protein
VLVSAVREYAILRSDEILKASAEGATASASSIAFGCSRPDETDSHPVAVIYITLDRRLVPYPYSEVTHCYQCRLNTFPV